MQGEVVGINSAKYADSAVEGMGYAIAISDVADSLENMMNAKARDKVDNHGILGITGSTVMKSAGVTEELKARDQMKWVGLMNSLKAQAEEIILSELVYN